uniref:Uncharacterized protein n=1 Tax=Setaria digitata TaxID=48799 RepID=A0A915PLI2_9BILA
MTFIKVISDNSGSEEHSTYRWGYLWVDVRVARDVRLEQQPEHYRIKWRVIGHGFGAGAQLFQMVLNVEVRNGEM